LLQESLEPIQFDSRLSFSKKFSFFDKSRGETKVGNESDRRKCFFLTFS